MVGQLLLGATWALLTLQTVPALAQEVLPFPDPPMGGKVGPTLQESVHQWRETPSYLPEDAPNILIVMFDDAGFGQPDTFGGEIHTPTLTRLAEEGIAYNRFHTTAMCSPTRAALMTGRNHHRVGAGIIAEFANDWDGYTGVIPKSSATIAEVLGHYGYATSAFGKDHNTPVEQIANGPYDRTPTGRGFDYFYGFIAGETSQWEPTLWENTTPISMPHVENYEDFHLTEAMADKAITWMRRHLAMNPDRPFLMWWTPGAVHGPHHVAQAWADKYEGKFDDGWDAYQQRVFERQKAMGWIPEHAQRPPRPEGIAAWEDIPDDEKAFQARLMEVYAGFFEHTDAQVGRLIDAEELSVKESALTGESLPVWKQVGTLPPDTPLVECTNMLFKGTAVMTGSGKGVVTGTGLRTELGKIQQMGIASEAPHTPLEKKLKALTIRLIWLTAILTVLIMISGVVRGAGWVQMLETSLALAVAAIPEGLPIVATMALARGMFRLSRQQVVVKNLEAIQTLGATDIILTDKTGTLTEDALSVRSICYGSDLKSGAKSLDSTEDTFPHPGADRVFDLLIHACVLCNNAEKGQEGPQGDSLEEALLEFAGTVGFDVGSLRLQYPEVWELPFDARRKFMATAHRVQDRFVIHVKGAFEVLVAHCNQILGPDGAETFENKEVWGEEVSRMASKGLRTLAFAYKTSEEPAAEATVLDDLVFQLILRIGKLGCFHHIAFL